MRVLILGGTKFLGRHLAESALAQGHSVTLFNRGRQSAGLYPEAEHLRGDRDGDLTALTGAHGMSRSTPAATCPASSRASAQLLADAVEHYSFVSTISVYAGWPALSRIDEVAPVGTLADPTVEEVTGESYGPLKALCEQAVRGDAAGTSAGRAAGADRRALRSDRPLQLLAISDRAWRRGAGSGQARGSDPGHRRA